MIETEHFTIRPATLEDAPGLHELYTDRDVKKYLGGWDSFEETTRFLRGQLMRAERRGYGLMAITDKATGKIIGAAKVDNSPLEPPNHVELTIGLLSGWRGKGLGQEVVTEMVKWGCQVTNSDRVVGVVKQDNAKSLKMLRALGAEQIEDRKPPLDGEPEHVFVLRPKDGD